MEEILDPKSLRKMVCEGTGDPLSRRPAKSPLRLRGIAAARESDPLAGRQSSPHPTATLDGAGFLRLTPSSNNGRESVHST